jgi:hypothetical protein
MIVVTTVIQGAFTVAGVKTLRCPRRLLGYAKDHCWPGTTRTSVVEINGLFARM